MFLLLSFVKGLAVAFIAVVPNLSGSTDQQQWWVEAVGKWSFILSSTVCASRLGPPALEYPKNYIIVYYIFL